MPLDALQQAAYSLEQPLLTPFVQSLITSAVSPSSAARATGLPTIATPRPIENLWPCALPWCLWWLVTNLLASFKFIGLISKTNTPALIIQTRLDALCVTLFLKWLFGRGVVVIPDSACVNLYIYYVLFCSVLFCLVDIFNIFNICH